jgi:hypothetical protein
MALSEHVEFKNDKWSVGSKKKLKVSLRNKMKRIFVGILNLLDNERLQGNISDRDASRLRSHILDIGNDQIRNMERELDERYNIEFMPYSIEFRLQD